ncbi:hypothetical protein ACJX0J_027356, partial [Zea mays]
MNYIAILYGSIHFFKGKMSSKIVSGVVNGIIRSCFLYAHTSNLQKNVLSSKIVSGVVNGMYAL